MASVKYLTWAKLRDVYAAQSGYAGDIPMEHESEDTLPGANFMSVYEPLQPIIEVYGVITAHVKVGCPHCDSVCERVWRFSSLNPTLVSLYKYVGKMPDESYLVDLDIYIRQAKLFHGEIVPYRTISDKDDWHGDGWKFPCENCNNFVQNVRTL